MKITISKVNKETGESKELLFVNDEKIKEYLVKAGTFILVNGIVGRVFPARRNIGMLINGGISAGITKLIFEKINKCDDAEEAIEVEESTVVSEAPEIITETEDPAEDDLK